MTIFPCAKINLGLNITSRRPDGYHNLETVFYPIPLFDAIEIHKIDNAFPTQKHYDLNISGLVSSCGEETNNLVIKAFNLLAQNYSIPRTHIHLNKQIPSQAGMGGGSSDASSMLKLLNKYYHLGISNKRLEEYSLLLGADCPFFINATPAYAEGIGEKLYPISDLRKKLKGLYILIIKPDIAISTKEAFSNIVPRLPEKSCKEIIKAPVRTWKKELINDFENSIFPSHPILRSIKNKLYKMGAIYAQMSGSGSSIFGIFENNPKYIEPIFYDCFSFSTKL